jgi:acyl-CoA reductase-like NAD-dependent aldehyde dehydrogenase
LRLFDLKPTAANTVIEILRKLAQLMDGRRDYLSCQIASEGGKPLADAIVETERAIGGVRKCYRDSAQQRRVGSVGSAPTTSALDRSRRCEQSG